MYNSDDDMGKMGPMAANILIKNLISKCSTYGEVLESVKKYLADADKRRKEDPDNYNYIDVVLEDSLNSVKEIIEEEYENLALHIDQEDFQYILKIRLRFGE